MTLATFLNSCAGTYIKITESTINTVILIFSIHGNHKFAKVYFAKCILSSNLPKFSTTKVSLYTVYDIYIHRNHACASSSTLQTQITLQLLILLFLRVHISVLISTVSVLHVTYCFYSKYIFLHRSNNSCNWMTILVIYYHFVP